MRDFERLFADLEYRFTDAELLSRALTHRSKGTLNYERLEFLGDSILGFVVAQWLYHQFPDASEGTLSRMRASVVRKESLADVARAIGLSDWLLLGEGEQKSGGFQRDSILADTLEAVIGAIHLDSGLSAAEKFVDRHFNEILQKISPDTVAKDPKSRLQETLQSRGLPVPNYTIVNVTGPPHQQTFEVACEVAGEPAIFKAVGPSRRRAEQYAAKKALAKLVP
ncbi:MAG: ribonuclease III [Gammaproteobacteria bacterium]|nr:ribonuclease III [Gammaproteobacteria bacterium]